MSKKKIMLVFGTRPEAIKMAPLLLEMKKHQDKIEPVVVSTGQHKEMLAQVMRIFNLKADYDLDIMQKSQSLQQIVSKTVSGLEIVLDREKPDMLLVQGDTSTAFAAALSSFYHKITLGHIEAGLRTFDKFKPYPEEINRRLISVVSDLHFAPTKTSVNHLLNENIQKKNIYCSGNTVIDALLFVANKKLNLFESGLKLDVNKKIILVTTHRRESFGMPLRCICEGIRRLAEKYFDIIQVVLPVHKNPMVRSAVNEVLGNVSNVLVIEPMDYEPFVHLMKASYLILTDSGGIQEEAPSLGKPVLVLREKTERPEAIKAGTVKLIGVDADKIFKEAGRLLSKKSDYKKMQKVVNPYGDGKAAKRIISVILHYLGFKNIMEKEFHYK